MARNVLFIQNEILFCKICNVNSFLTMNGAERLRDGPRRSIAMRGLSIGTFPNVMDEAKRVSRHEGNVCLDTRGVPTTCLVLIGSIDAFT